MKLPWYTSWLVLIICFAGSAAIPPLSLVGLALLGIRVSLERKYFYTAGRSIRGIGWLFILMAILMFAYAIVEEDEEIIAAAFIFFVPGLIFLGIGKRSIKKGGIYSYYIDAIYNKGIRSVHQLAGLLSKTPEVVQGDIQKMINRKLLPDVSVVNYQLLVPSIDSAGQVKSNQQNVNQEEVNEKEHQSEKKSKTESTNKGSQQGEQEKVKSPKTVTCPGCGSRIVVRYGEEIECEFCGNIITY